MSTNTDKISGHCQPTEPEFSKIVQVDDLGVGKTVVPFEASKHELALLTKRLGVDGLDFVKGQATLILLDNGDVKMSVKAKSRVHQHCVVTLEPVRTDINIDFTTTYSEDADEDLAPEDEEFEDFALDIEQPEPLVDKKIDIAEACIEQLALEIDPFPRVKGATFDSYSTDRRSADAPESGKQNPFAVLSKLKTKQENE